MKQNSSYKVKHHEIDSILDWYLIMQYHFSFLMFEHHDHSQVSIKRKFIYSLKKEKKTNMK